jgi:hypothetical protein
MSIVMPSVSMLLEGGHPAQVRHQVDAQPGYLLAAAPEVDRRLLANPGRGLNSAAP